MKLKAFFIILKEPSLKQFLKKFLKGESPTLMKKKKIIKAFKILKCSITS